MCEKEKEKKNRLEEFLISFLNILQEMRLLLLIERIYSHLFMSTGQLLDYLNLEKGRSIISKHMRELKLN